MLSLGIKLAILPNNNKNKEARHGKQSQAAQKADETSSQAHGRRRIQRFNLGKRKNMEKD